MKQPMQQAPRRSPLIEHKEFFANSKADEWELVINHCSDTQEELDRAKSPAVDVTSDDTDCVAISDSSEVDTTPSSNHTSDKDEADQDRVDQLADEYTEKSARLKASRFKEQLRRRQNKKNKKLRKADKKQVHPPVKSKSKSSMTEPDSSVMDLSDVDQASICSTAAIASVKEMDTDMSSEDVITVDYFDISPEIVSDERADQERLEEQKDQPQQEQSLETAEQPPTAPAAPVQPTIVYKKGDLLFYRRTSEMATCPPLKIKIVGVHHDDFPNIYYTIQTCPRNEQIYLSDPEYPLFEERQTDNKYLHPLDHVFEDCNAIKQQEEKKREEEEEEEELSSANLSENEHDPSPSPVEDSHVHPLHQNQQHHCTSAFVPTPCASRSEPVTYRTAPAAPVVQALPVEVREFESYYLIQGRAPGVRAEDLQVTVEEGNCILIKAFSHTLGVTLQQQVKFPTQPVAGDLPSTAVRLNGGILSLEVPKIARKRCPIQQQQQQRPQRRSMYSSNPFNNSSYNGRLFSSPFSSPFF